MWSTKRGVCSSVVLCGPWWCPAGGRITGRAFDITHLYWAMWNGAVPTHTLLQSRSTVRHSGLLPHSDTIQHAFFWVSSIYRTELAGFVFNYFILFNLMYFCPTGGALLIGITKCSVICVQWRLQEYAVLSLFCWHEDLRPNSEPTWLKSKTILYDKEWKLWEHRCKTKMASQVRRWKSKNGRECFFNWFINKFGNEWKRR